ncbi:hypothetical protein DSM21852_39710 [Methylocystis bryophila]|nr:hypothetical protein DSM21852_39710 [Methylocystis bryophila]
MIFAAIVATLIGAAALIGLRDKIVRVSPRDPAPSEVVSFRARLAAPPEGAPAPARFARNENEAKAK